MIDSIRYIFRFKLILFFLISLPSWAFFNKPAENYLSSYAVPTLKQPEQSPAEGCTKSIKGASYFHPVNCFSKALAWYDRYLAGNEGARSFFEAHVEYALKFAEQDGDALLFPYGFDWSFGSYHTYQAPWYSGMAQGMALSAMVRYVSIQGNGRQTDTIDQIKSIRNSLDPRHSDRYKITMLDNNRVWLEEYPWHKDELGRIEANHTINGSLMGILGVFEFEDWAEQNTVDFTPIAEDFISAYLTTQQDFITEFAPKYSLIDQSKLPVYIWFNSLGTVHGDVNIQQLSITSQHDPNCKPSHQLLFNDGCGKYTSPYDYKGRIAFELMLHGDTSEPIHVEAIEIRAENGRTITSIDLNKGHEGKEGIYARPRFGYSWSQPTNNDVGVYRTLDPKNPNNAWFYFSFPLKTEAPDEIYYLALKLKSDSQAKYILRMPNTTCRYELGQGIADGSVTQFRLPKTTEIDGSSSFAYRGWHVREDSEQGYYKKAKLDSEGNINSWARLTPFRDKLSAATGYLLKIRYLDTFSGTVMLRLWNGNGHVLGAIKGEGSGNQKEEIIAIDAALIESNIGSIPKTFNLKYVVPALETYLSDRKSGFVEKGRNFSFGKSVSNSFSNEFTRLYFQDLESIVFALKSDKVADLDLSYCVGGNCNLPTFKKRYDGFNLIQISKVFAGAVKNSGELKVSGPNTANFEVGYFSPTTQRYMGLVDNGVIGEQLEIKLSFSHKESVSADN